MKRNWRPYLELYGQYRYQLLANALLATVALGSAIGLLALSGWFLTATALAGMSLASAQAFNFFTPGALVRLLAMGRTAGRYAERLFGHSLTLKVLAQLRAHFFRRLIPHLPGARLHQGELLQRLQQDIDALDHLYLRFLAPLISALLLLALLLGLLWMGFAQLALAVGLLLAAGLLLLAIPYSAGQMLGRDLARSEAVLQVQLYEYLGQQAVLQSYVAEPFARGRLAQAEEGLYCVQERLAELQARSRALCSLLPALLLLLMVGLLSLGPVEVLQASPWSAPEWAFVLFLFLALLELAAPLPDALLFFGRSQTAIDRLEEASSAPAVAFPCEQAGDINPAHGLAVTLKQVRFAYPGAAPILRDASLQLARGERLALLGPSGIGKSTLIGLLARWFDPDAGSIELWGHPIAEYSEPQLRRQFAVLPQEVDLLAASLAENLRLAKPEASADELLAVLEQVELGYLASEAEALERCRIGPGGRTLSGGERRRIGIARLLLSEAPIWVLDEPTEGLDLALEQRLVALLDRVLAERTLLLISHRPQALSLCQRQLWLQEGRFIAQDTG